MIFGDKHYINIKTAVWMDYPDRSEGVMTTKDLLNKYDMTMAMWCWFSIGLIFNGYFSLLTISNLHWMYRASIFLILVFLIARSVWLRAQACKFEKGE